MSITRRELLRRAGLLGVATTIPCFTAACTGGSAEGDEAEGSETAGTETGSTGGGDGLPEYVWDGETGPESLFSHSVASGDPLADSVILWTRVTPDLADAELFYEVALDPEFSMRIAADYLGPPDPSRDFTFKLDLAGLIPATTYYYRFWIQGRSSPIGRTRTAPDGASDHLRFGVCSCSSYAHGYFHNYRSLGERADLDAVIHLGDYIYEYATGSYGNVREYEPATEILTLDDYRMRYAQYRRDPDLQEVHRQHPFIVTWDDHELTNDAWQGGAENHQPDEGDWDERAAIAKQVYFEWLPLREGPAGGVYRDLPYGDLIDIVILDTRYTGREEQLTADDIEGINDPDRQLLGAEQEAWLFERLSASTSTWKLLAQQVMMGHVIISPGVDGEPNRPLLTDSWDGYEYARRRLLQHIEQDDIQDVVVITGDIHSSWAHEIAINPVDPASYDPATGDGALAVEFVTPGISSPGLQDAIDPATLSFLQMLNPHIRYTNLDLRGYIVLDVLPERVQADWWHLPEGSVESPDPASPEFATAWRVEGGASVLFEADTPAAQKADAPPLAP